MTQQTMLTDGEIAKIADKVLRREFKGLGLERLDIRSEDDFDGESIIRIDARLRSGRAPVERLTHALDELRSELIAKGEHRFVFLSSAQPDPEPAEHEPE
jgi:hypothetical protein